MTIAVNHEMHDELDLVMGTCANLAGKPYATKRARGAPFRRDIVARAFADRFNAPASPRARCLFYEIDDADLFLILGGSMSAGAHTLELRNQFIEGVNRSIIDIGRHQEDSTFTPLCLWIDEANTKFFRLCLDGCPLPLPHGDGLLQAFTFDELIEQLDQIVIIAGFGGLDDALIVCVNHRRE